MKTRLLKELTAYDEDKSWALDTWDEGVNDQSHADTEEVDD